MGLNRMRVFHLALAVIFLGMVAIAGARVIGSTQPRSAIAAIFTNPDDSPCEMPCMFGIRPFSTRLVDLPQILATQCNLCSVGQ